MTNDLESPQSPLLSSAPPVSRISVKEIEFAAAIDLSVHFFRNDRTKAIKR
ncbi:MAG: hypothetical protein ABI619_06785 [Betaproteobacteria bacterium]